ncbi:unnamed protein product [Dibothriocephalus latus]|uniref:Roadblock/LAMTOR2 domain-containing protein n=1 Tax=Dibothriocephalus latus TaxID=60516 RepID=A0A3P7L7M9_DIBLA|nr:unnamed protein product [Dibothriocephalus latus]
MSTSSGAPDANADMLLRIERIQNHKNVQGLVLINAEGNPVRSNMDNSTSLQYTRHTEELRAITQHVIRDLDPEDDLIVLRIRTRLNEIMVLPELNNNSNYLFYGHIRESFVTYFDIIERLTGINRSSHAIGCLVVIIVVLLSIL